jgi:hypothetical protein
MPPSYQMLLDANLPKASLVEFAESKRNLAKYF